jgi:hypothetical protein
MQQTHGILNLSAHQAVEENKVTKLFTKLKKTMPRRTPMGPTMHESGQGIPIREVEPNLDELARRAMNSFKVGPEVLKTEEGYEVV